MLKCPVCGSICRVGYKEKEGVPYRAIGCENCSFSSYYFKKFEDAVANYYKFKYIIDTPSKEILESYVRDSVVRDYLKELFKDESN